MLENDQRKSDKGDHETASERLKRLLAEAKNEQPVESLGDLARPEKAKSMNLDDTSPIRVSKSKVSDIKTEEIKGEGLAADV